MTLPNECRDCPYWHREGKEDDWPWDSPWGDCEKLPEADNPLIEYDVPWDKCPLRVEAST